MEDALWLHLQWEIWEDAVVFGDHEVVDHSWSSDRDINLRSDFTVLVDDREMNAFLNQIISIGQHFTCLSINLGVGTDGVVELTAEVVVTDALNIKQCLALIKLDVEWEVGLKEGVCSFGVVGEGGVGLTFAELGEGFLISNRFL